MRSQSYYAVLTQGVNNLYRSDVDLAVNCCGFFNQQREFYTYRPSGRNDYYLQYITKGHLKIWTKEGIKIINKGQAILYYPHELTRYESYGNEGVEYFWVHFTGKKADEMVRRFHLLNREFMNVHSGSYLELLFENLMGDFVSRDDYFELSISTRMQMILIEVARQIEAKPERTGGEMTQVLAYLHRHYLEELPTEKLAEKAHLSESRFRVLFKEYTGYSPKDYQTTLKINKAQELLEQTDYDMKYIAGILNYSDQLYFSRIFKQRIGMSPTEYRRNHKESEVNDEW